ncbi:flippase [Agaricicola taiwanensis]|uniref:Flippase n=1 Tax=Agaricicola taiwanensis TaxID=591372 RepID=A0A8J2YFH2_9RHOB|nr:polysaccharide biosynthesis C-terminal domain-containing protein [Agaricicola taiwanensis]GGE29790.1 flippase [Agaricicola taiwanensis]
MPKFPSISSRQDLKALAARLMRQDEGRRAWLTAGMAFMVRVTSAAMLLVTQILLARWMGSHEFGVYIFAWTIIVMVGDLMPLGFVMTAQRVIPEARHHGEAAALRGFLLSSRLFTFAAATAAMLVLIALAHLAAPWLSNIDPRVITIAAFALPAYAVVNVMDGIARSFDRVNLGLVPPLIGRPIMLVLLVGGAHLMGFTTDAVTGVTAAVIATWALASIQLVLLGRHLRAAVGPGPRDYRFRSWLSVSLQIFASICCVSLFTYADIIVLNIYAEPADVAIYYAALKVVGITSFIGFAIAAVMGHRFVERQVAGDRAGLEQLLAQAVKATFWSTAALMAVILLLGRFILALFGPDFTAGYSLLPILALAFLCRASVGPAERVLTMLGEQRAVARVYAAAFVANLGASLMLIPLYGLTGAAFAVTIGTGVEALMLYRTVRRRLGLHAFIVGGAGVAKPGYGAIP